jgi:aminodeoxyfutalosine deaminase
VAILPGMVNAHTHLEFSHLPRPIGNRGLKLHDWIGQVVRHRQQSTIKDQAESIASGLSASRALGTSLIADIATTPLPALADTLASMPDQSNAVPEVIFLAEVLGLVPDRSNEKLRAATELMEQIDGPSYARVGISPHAPYSTPMAVVSECVELAKRRGCLLAMHVAESEEERELVEQGVHTSFLTPTSSSRG